MVVNYEINLEFSSRVQQLLKNMIKDSNDKMIYCILYFVSVFFMGNRWFTYQDGFFFREWIS